jgi:diphthamide synthase (EF-2-diphthine--ammonia ligase)
MKHKIHISIHQRHDTGEQVVTIRNETDCFALHALNIDQAERLARSIKMSLLTYASPLTQITSDVKD